MKVFHSVAARFRRLFESGTLAGNDFRIRLGRFAFGGGWATFALFCTFKLNASTLQGLLQEDVGRQNVAFNQFQRTGTSDESMIQAGGQTSSFQL